MVRGALARQAFRRKVAKVKHCAELVATLIQWEPPSLVRKVENTPESAAAGVQMHSLRPP